jgi:hypothetical protein
MHIDSGKNFLLLPHVEFLIFQITLWSWFIDFLIASCFLAVSFFMFISELFFEESIPGPFLSNISLTQNILSWCCMAREPKLD